MPDAPKSALAKVAKKAAQKRPAPREGAGPGDVNTDRTPAFIDPDARYSVVGVCRLCQQGVEHTEHKIEAA